MEMCKRAWNKFCSSYGPTILNTISPTWFLLCILGLNGMANDHIWEYLYGGRTELCMISLGIVWFMSAQMIIHWLFLCKVTSNYINTEENNSKRLEHEKSYPQLTSEGVEYEKLREKRPTLGTGNWSVITHYNGENVKRVAYPYWGWKPCVVCSCYKPARCHHCPICDICVLKRDHHCFFARQCVGLHNQRYFVVYNFWAVLLTSFVTPHIFHYTRVAIWPSMTLAELFLPWTLVSYLVGRTNFYVLALVFQDYSLVFFILTAGGFLCDQLKCIDMGLTSHEREQRDQVIQSRCKSRYERFACVFGRRHIWLNLLIPYHWACEPADNGITWESMKLE